MNSDVFVPPTFSMTQNASINPPLGLATSADHGSFGETVRVTGRLSYPDACINSAVYSISHVTRRHFYSREFNCASQQ